MNITEKIGLPALLEQCAEECNELAHACLKYSRILREENPTPISDDPEKVEKVKANICEEAADISACVTEMIEGAKLFSYEAFDSFAITKTERWNNRILNK